MSAKKVHAPDFSRGPALVSRCGLYSLPAALAVHDPRRDRFSTVEEDVDCGPCRTTMREDRAPVPAVLAVAASELPVAAEPRLVTRQHFDVSLLRYVERVEREEVVRPRWANWRAAVRAYAQWIDDGAPLRSTMDPARFEALPQGGSGVPQGDAAQRQAEVLAPVRAAMRVAYAEGWTLEARGRIPPFLFRWTVESYVAGRSETDRTGSAAGKRKQRITKRVPWHLEDDRIPETGAVRAQGIASVLAGWLGYGVSPGEAREMIRGAGVTIERELGALVALRDEWLYRVERGAEEGSEMGIHDGKLQGWAAIAAFLDCHEDTARQYERMPDPIPVRRFGLRERSRVVADPEEIRAWHERNSRRSAG